MYNTKSLTCLPNSDVFLNELSRTERYFIDMLFFKHFIVITFFLAVLRQSNLMTLMIWVGTVDYDRLLWLSTTSQTLTGLIPATQDLNAKSPSTLPNLEVSNMYMFVAKRIYTLKVYCKLVMIIKNWQPAERQKFVGPRPE